MPGSTVIRAIREGSEFAQNIAAERVGVTPATLAAYELGRFTPSTSKTWQIVRSLALGSPAKSERNPRFLLTYSLFGQRFLADGAGRLVVFVDPWVAHEQADRLIGAGFLKVSLVPVWRGRRRSLVARINAPGEAPGDEMEDPLAVLLEYAAQLAKEFDRLHLQPKSPTSST